MICSPPFTAANKSTGMPEVARAAEPYPYRSRIAASAAAVAVSRSPSMDGHHAVLEVPFDEHRRRDTQPEHDHLPPQGPRPPPPTPPPPPPPPAPHRATPHLYDPLPPS